MAQRLKYVKVSETEYKTEGYINTFAKGEVIATFDTVTNTFKIMSPMGTSIYAEGVATSPHKIKIKIKEALIKLGAQFEKEKRQPRKSIQNETQTV